MGDQLDIAGLGSFTVTTPGAGLVNLFLLSLDTVSDLNDLQAGEFILAAFAFNAIGAGTSPLGLTLLALGDADGNSLSADFGTGSITATPTSSSVPEPASMLLASLGLAICWLFAAARRTQAIS